RERVDSMPKNCGECGNCVASCPNNALQGDFLDARRCISFHTIESKKIYEEKPVNFAGSIFGCERCIKACPWHKEISGWPEFETKAPLLSSLKREDWQNMSEERFKEQFSDSSLLRAGLAKIKNNL
ncbi:MAG: epoxyqueuosine reductase, partial [Bacteroidales bacterium]|nr:epoxyqueuosine reductase [Bacteroidales bacterium]